RAARVVQRGEEPPSTKGVLPMPNQRREARVPSYTAVSPAAAAALAELQEAYKVTHRHCWPVWDFALGIDRLLQKGLSETELRTLVRLGAVEHATETTKPSGRSRTFGRGRSLVFGVRSSFVLTEVGAKMLARLRGSEVDGRISAARSGRAKTPSGVPHWNAEE